MVCVECPSANNPNSNIFGNNGLKPHNMRGVENVYRNEFQDILVQNRLPVFSVLESIPKVCHHFSYVPVVYILVASSRI